eukprot:TRINITY_DN2874_c0_g1_i1.p1 TRINITY_DN2874_c0_g1~~TRINITY_DN2874_c0_g1_i1.p1  ORF type:complete len:394 (+),score=147.03 TRINITY_DN2874_c0_g1_i1:71-1252(+)
MAPKRGNKRAREAAEPAVDAAADATEKASKQLEQLRPVAEAIEASTLSDSCKAMLLAFVPVCLDTPCDARDPLQAMAVSMLGQFFEARQAEFTKAIEEESAKLVEVEAGAGDLDAKVSNAERQLAEVGEASLEAKKKELAAASQAMVATKAAAADAKEAQRNGDATYADALEEKTAVEAILSENLPALRDSNWEAIQAKVHIEAMMPVAKRLKLDASLLSAMPSSLIKEPNQRGPFDQMVIQQLEEVLNSKAVTLGQQIEAEGPAAQDRAAAVEAAQKAAEEAKVRQQQAASAVFEAQAVVKDLNAALDEAKAAKEGFGPQFREATQVRDRKVKELEAFESINTVCFTKFRDRTSENSTAGSGAAVAEVTGTSPKKVVEQAVHPATQVAVGGQ